jgi:hypothetical protein
MDDSLFLAMCGIVLFISGGVIFAKFGEVDGLSVIALALLAILGAVYASKRKTARGVLNQG